MPHTLSFRKGRRRGGRFSEEKGRRHSAVIEPLYQVTFSASERCMELLQRAQELVFQGQKLKLGEVMEEALEEFVARHCPNEKEKRRVERKAKKLQKNKEESKAARDDSSAEPVAGSRYIREAVRAEVLARDGYC